MYEKEPVVIMRHTHNLSFIMNLRWKQAALRRLSTHDLVRSFNANALAEPVDLLPERLYLLKQMFAVCGAPEFLKEHLLHLLARRAIGCVMQGFCHKHDRLFSYHSL